MSNYFDHLLSLDTPTETFAQTAKRFEPSTVLWAFHTIQPSSFTTVTSQCTAKMLRLWLWVYSQYSIGCLVVCFPGMISSLAKVNKSLDAHFQTLFSKIVLFFIFLNFQIDFVILKTDVEQFTLTTKKSLRITFNFRVAYPVCNSCLLQLCLLSFFATILYCC